jgi:hypothetical protein
MAKKSTALAKYELPEAQLVELSETARATYDTRLDAIRSMNAALRGEFDRMIEKDVEQTKSNMDFYYWLGDRVRAIQNASDDKYGPTPIQKLVEAWSVGGDLLYKALDFVETYSREQFDALRESGIRWTHVKTLLSITDQSTRESLTQRIVEEGLSTRELTAAVRRLNADAGSTRQGGGRPPMRPRTITAGLDQITSVSDTWITRNQSVWSDGDESVLASLETMPPAEYTDELAAQLDQVISTMERMAALCAANVSRGNQIRERIRESLDPQEVTDDDESDEEAAAPSVAQRALRRARRRNQ